MGNFPKLSEQNLNLLSTGLFYLMVCLGIKIVNASDLALNVADNQVVVGNSAKELKQLASELSTQAEVVRRKDEAYRELSRVYEQSLAEAEGYERLKSKIETIRELPEVDNLDQIESDIFSTESDLLEVIK
ncbi:MAG: hypothetical protein HC930_02895 [Hydrococcus sp. SU_1_0]|nr:hypothetical protein [Hydrococcus sp. SU_1_0]